MKRNQTKPVFLNAEKTRAKLMNSALGGELLGVMNAVDTMSGLYDGLTKLHATPDPNLTREARALKYKRRFEQASEAVRKKATSAAEQLDILERRIKSDAEVKAGLHSPQTEAAAQEIRSVLRSLDQKARDKMLRDAALSGDVAILQAVRNATTPALYGGTTEPVESLIDMHLQKVAPELAEQRAALDAATHALNLAVDSYMSTTNELRDPMGEHIAEKQEADTRSAEEQLLAALGTEAVEGGQHG